MRKYILSATLIILSTLSHDALTQETRWNLSDDGSITWKVDLDDKHSDHVEMSGLNVSVISRYGVANGLLQLKIFLVFPMLRTIPNDTHASLRHEFDNNIFPQLKVDGRRVQEYPVKFQQKGFLKIESKTNVGLQIVNRIFPSTDKPAVIQKITLNNVSDREITVQIPAINEVVITDAQKGVYGSYTISATNDKHGPVILKTGASFEFAIIYRGEITSHARQYVSPDYEWYKRQEFVKGVLSRLVFESPNDTINRAFAFAKIRATESIFDTRGGLMHGPGGGAYYAAVWANDQAEYANPFFPFLGNPEGNESAINAFRHFAKYMNEAYEPIPSSIIAEGTDFWNGAGDRGDMAMIAYGASRFAMAYGRKQIAIELWPLIEWCLEYCRRKVNSKGVVASDSDELEGRFPAGNANLNTTSLYYDALISAGLLGEVLNIPASQTDLYATQADSIREIIERHFGARVEGFETYRYYEGNKLLRSWICTPLTVGIFDRKEGTIEALFSPKLWTSDGLLTQSGDNTFWDRSTLYGLRGAFAAGATDRAMPYLAFYSAQRLLGDHVPYPVEAYPEGNQRHLSAESALYCRVITEGLWGVRPIGLSSFSVTPQLHTTWQEMTLRNIMAFDTNFDLNVKREHERLRFIVLKQGIEILNKIISPGDTVTVNL
jgi:hypothetical protein